MPNYDKFPIVTKTLKGVEIDRHHLRLTAGTAKQEQCVDAKELTDDILMLTTPIVYGFSLADKTWCKLCISSLSGDPESNILHLIVEFVVELVEPFQWNNEAYANLVIPPEQKMLLTTLVESHNSSPAAKFDDFVEGKGLGLVINLFGNPGTGPCFSSLPCGALNPLTTLRSALRQEFDSRGDERV